MIEQLYEMEKETEEEIIFPSTEGDIPHVYYSTTEYEKFSLIYFNREISEEEVQLIIKAIEEGKNYLRVFPIVVNSKFEITDGQHRYRAAERLELPLYYIVDDDFVMEDAIAANTVTTNWTTKEYMNSYAKKGFPEYIKLRNFYLENPWIKISLLPKLCSRNTVPKFTFQRGHYKADRIDYAKKVVAMVNSLRPIIGDNQAEYRYLILTMMNLAQNPNYNHKRMLEKLKQRTSLFRRCADVEQYLSMFTQIYNYRVSPQNRVQLTEFYIRQKWQRDTK